jgi:hypothetical protein
VKTLRGELSNVRRFLDDSEDLIRLRLNQSLMWTFYERTATALYDYAPREPNQLPLRKGCLVCE